MEVQLAQLGQGAEVLWALFLAYIPNVFAALLMLVAGWIIAGWAKRAVVSSLERFQNLDVTLRPFVGNIVRYAILAVVIVAVLGQFGIQTASVLAVLGAAGLAIGLALQGTLSNIAAGLMLLWLRPFRTGEYIDSAAGAGMVKEVGLFTTEIITFDGLYKMIPNSTLWNDNILNYSRMPTRRMDFVIGISYDDDVARARQVIREALDADKRILADPEPVVFLDNLGESSLDIVMRAWANSSDYWAARYEILEDIKNRMDAAGITIPYPQRDVHVYHHGDSGDSGDSGDGALAKAAS